MKLFLVSFLRIHRLRVLSPSSKTHETRKWPRAWLKARDWRGTLARACTPLTKWTARSLGGKYTEKNWKSSRSPPQSPPRPRIWRPLFMYQGRRLACARTGDILACLYLDKAAYLWRRELELWQYNDPLWMFTGVRFFEHFCNIKFVARMDSYLDLKSTTASQQSAPNFISCITGLKFSS